MLNFDLISLTEQLLLELKELNVQTKENAKAHIQIKSDHGFLSCKNVEQDSMLSLSKTLKHYKSYLYDSFPTGLLLNDFRTVFLWNATFCMHFSLGHDLNTTAGPEQLWPSSVGLNQFQGVSYS